MAYHYLEKMLDYDQLDRLMATNEIVFMTATDYPPRDIIIPNRSFQYAALNKYFGMTVTNENFVQVAIKRRLNSGNA
jgi:hypothetical protein